MVITIGAIDYTGMYRDLMLEALEGCQLPKIASSLCHTKISATYNPWKDAASKIFLVS